MGKYALPLDRKGHWLDTVVSPEKDFTSGDFCVDHSNSRDVIKMMKE